MWGGGGGEGEGDVVCEKNVHAIEDDGREGSGGGGGGGGDGRTGILSALATAWKSTTKKAGSEGEAITQAVRF
jgi:hypothetical protein